MQKIKFATFLSFLLVANAVQAGINDTIQGDVSESMVVYGRLQSAKSGCTVLMSKYVIALNNTAASLPEQGDKTNGTLANDEVYITLGGKDCDANEGYKNIGLKFIGTTDDVEGNTLANTDMSNDAAKGVSIQLSDMYDKIIRPNIDVGMFPGTSTEGNATTATASYPLNFTLVHLKNQQATAGAVKTNLVVQIERL